MVRPDWLTDRQGDSRLLLAWHDGCARQAGMQGVRVYGIYLVSDPQAVLFRREARGHMRDPVAVGLHAEAEAGARPSFEDDPSDDVAWPGDLLKAAYAHRLVKGPRALEGDLIGSLDAGVDALGTDAGG